MNIIVSGGGLIRLSSAYFLQKSGYNVILIEQANKVSIGTTFTNSGQFSIRYSEPFGSISNFKKWKIGFKKKIHLF